MDLAESVVAYMGTANGKGMTAAIVKAYGNNEVGEPNLYVYGNLQCLRSGSDKAVLTEK
jgi:hypothetical protein